MLRLAAGDMNIMFLHLSHVESMFAYLDAHTSAIFELSSKILLKQTLPTAYQKRPFTPSPNFITNFKIGKIVDYRYFFKNSFLNSIC